MGKTCSFFGHSHLYGQSEEVAQQLRQIITNLIAQGVDTFYVGNHGEFDLLSSRVSCDLKTLYPDVQVVVVLCYPNELQYLRCQFTDFLMPPEIEAVPKRACIVKRNQWVIDSSDYIVSYIKYKMGGAYEAIQYAEKHHKKIIEISALTKQAFPCNSAERLTSKENADKISSGKNSQRMV